MLGIFIEPKYELKNYINKWKFKIKKNYSNTKYIFLAFDYIAFIATTFFKA